MADDSVTRPTAVPVEDFLATIPDRRRPEADELIAVMREITGEPAVMWGPSIIGFGSLHYRYDTGREGDMPRLAFSPRKATLTIYFEGFDGYGEQLAKLGRHKTGASCLYLNKLSDADPAVLREMLATSYARSGAPASKVSTVDEYVTNVPAVARPMFDELRSLVRDALPRADEVFSYGIVGYKPVKGRARVFISGWKDHVAVYPIPADPQLADELKAYTRGKGTLWFPLSDPLPRDLIRRVVAALVADVDPAGDGPRS
ncbi:DUF1801 domain-containing protein [Tessaracoccus sp. G1721]